MFLAMIGQEEIHAYFASGRIKSEITVGSLLMSLPKTTHFDPSNERDAHFRKYSDDEIADAVKDKIWRDKIVEFDNELDCSDGFRRISQGFFEYAEFIDWESGEMTVNYLPSKKERPEHIFWDQDELLNSYVDDPDISAKFEGMAFRFDQIELLLPTHKLHAYAVDIPLASERRPIGRPRKWDWEGAMFDIATTMATPDFKINDTGKQAHIETLFSEWFIDKTGDSPSVSQIRDRASRLMRMVEKAEKSD